MQLVIAEKPSVARDLARVLGVRASGRNALEGDGRVISWCIGHLVELEEPAAYDPRWKSWRMDTLPMLPSSFKLRPVAGTRDQLRVVSDLLRSRRFSEVVNACDAGREGELIFRYVYELAGSRLPVRRLWISSLTDEAIRQGFAGLRPGTAYDPLADAARCRSEADWLVGMNATRAVTIQFRAQSGGGGGGGGGERGGGEGVRREAPGRAGRAAGGRARRGGVGAGGPLPAVYSIGRVQTPTLAILVRREQAILAFEPRDYWEVRGTFELPGPDGGGAAGPDGGTQTFTALWTLRPADSKGLTAKAAVGTITRFGTRALADVVVARAAAAAHPDGAPGGEPGAVVERLIQKETREPPPQLFDLTSLQRTANRRYGLSATSTLQAAQALYERHKVLTYPRTDSRHLPPDLIGELPKLFAGLAKVPAYSAFATPLLGTELSAAGRSRRIFDAAKVHDHHAIIPTGKVPAAGALGPDESRIFDLVARRFLGVFHPDAVFALTEVVIRAGEPAASADRPGPVPATEAADEPILLALPPPPDRFFARGRIRLAAGWQAVAGFDERRPAPNAGAARTQTDAAAGSEGAAESTLPALAEGQRLTARFEPVKRQTRPPSRHSEATLLGAMESAGREIDDEALRAAMKETGLGTPATRAATIETLLKRGFISREGKQVFATPTGIALIEGLPVATLASPELTGAWEARLVRIARGQDTRAAFMTDIVRYVREVTDTVRALCAGKTPPRGRPAAPPPAGHPPLSATTRPSTAKVTELTTELSCPRCQQGSVVTGKRGWGCSRWREGCPFVIWFDMGGKRITATQLRDLVKKGKTRKSRWSGTSLTTSSTGPVVGHLVLDLTASREQGAARFAGG